MRLRSYEAPCAGEIRSSPRPSSFSWPLPAVSRLWWAFSPRRESCTVSSSLAPAWRTRDALVSLPVFQFVLWRSLFRWGLWVFVLGGFSRVPLRLLPMHADRRGGIGFLKTPSINYCGVLLFAVSSALCGAWGTQVLLVRHQDRHPGGRCSIRSCSLAPSSPLLHC